MITASNTARRSFAKLLVLTLATQACAMGLAHASTWYVSPLGNDKNVGHSSATPLRHIQAAANLTHPGDTVLIMSGTYDAAGAHDVVDISISGTQAAPITYKAAPGQHPVIDFANAWAGFQINAAYIVVQGLEFAGGAQTITAAYAQAQAKNLANIRTTSSAIVIANYLTGATSHHITITGNTIHDAPGAGIQANFSDYITVTANVVYRNAYWSPYANSGISLWELRDIDNNTGIKNRITGNICYQNQEFIANTEGGGITDGNGIIIDDNKNTQTNNIPYGGRTYVADNIVYANGGSGIHAYASAHVDIVNNTAYLNNASPAINEGQIFAAASSDVRIMNNILFAPAGKTLYSNWQNDNTVDYNYNVLFSTNLQSAFTQAPAAPHDIVANPKFVAPLSANFHLAAGSPAIGTGLASIAPPADIDGNPQPTKAGITRGAYDYP